MGSWKRQSRQSGQNAAIHPPAGRSERGRLPASGPRPLPARRHCPCCEPAGAASGRPLAGPRRELGRRGLSPHQEGPQTAEPRSGLAEMFCSSAWFHPGPPGCRRLSSSMLVPREMLSDSPSKTTFLMGKQLASWASCLAPPGPGSLASGWING